MNMSFKIFPKLKFLFSVSGSLSMLIGRNYLWGLLIISHSLQQWGKKHTGFVSISFVPNPSFNLPHPTSLTKTQPPLFACTTWCQNVLLPLLFHSTHSASPLIGNVSLHYVISLGSHLKLLTNHTDSYSSKVSLGLSIKTKQKKACVLNVLDFSDIHSPLGNIKFQTKVAQDKSRPTFFLWNVF